MYVVCADAGRSHACKVRCGRAVAWPLLCARRRRRVAVPRSHDRFARAAADGGAIANVAAWMESLGAVISEKVEVCTIGGPGSGQRGIFACKTLLPGDVVFSIPRECHVTGEFSDDLAPMLAEDRNATTLLAVRLLRDGAARLKCGGGGGNSAAKAAIVSPFAAYYRTLPRHVDSPLTWEAEDLVGLEGTHAYSILVGRQRVYQRQWEVLRHCRGFEGVTWDDFVWAMCIVASRCFESEDSTGRKRPCMVPLADLLNHNLVDGWFTAYSFGGDSFTLTCVKEIQEGEEVRITYGPKGNGSLLVEYGFALEKNEEANGYCPDEVAFYLPAPLDDEWKLGLLRAAGHTMDGRPVRITVTSMKDVPELLSVIRLVVADNEDAALARALPLSCVAKNAYQLRGVSLKNECAMIAALWRLSCERCAGLAPVSPTRSTEALRRAGDMAVWAMVGGGPPSSRTRTSTGSQKDSGLPAIVGIAREALLSGPVEEKVEASRGPCPWEEGAPWPVVRRPPGEEWIERAALHAWLVSLVVESERRVFAHFSALAVIVCAVLGLSGADRALVLPHIEGATPLAGLSDGSRRFIAKYVQGLCRKWGAELGTGRDEAAD